MAVLFLPSNSFFFFWLITLAKTSSTILKRSGHRGHSYLVFDLRKSAFYISPLVGC